MSGRRLRHGPRFSNTGLGGQPSLNQVYALFGFSRRHYRYSKGVEAELKADAKAGDVNALALLKRKRLARAAHNHGSKAGKVPTRVPLKWLEDTKT